MCLHLKKKKRKPDMVTCACKPVSGEVDPKDPWGLLVSQSSPLRELQALFPKPKWMALRMAHEVDLRLPHDVYTHEHTQN